MDINLIRIAVTVAALVAFVGIVGWVWTPRRKARFDAAARSILEGDER